MMPGEELDCQELELYKVDDVLYVGTRYAQALTYRTLGLCTSHYNVFDAFASFHFCFKNVNVK